jgi:hypothetical protein
MKEGFGFFHKIDHGNKRPPFKHMKICTFITHYSRFTLIIFFKVLTSVVRFSVFGELPKSVPSYYYFLEEPLSKVLNFKKKIRTSS